MYILKSQKHPPRFYSEDAHIKSLREWYEAKVQNYELNKDTANLFILKQVYHATIHQYLSQSCLGYEHTEQQKIHFGEYHLNLLFRRYGLAS